MSYLTSNLAARSCRGMRYPSLLLLLTTLFIAATSTAQMMKKGVSVDMPTTTSAIPMPNADFQRATVVAVTSAGRVFCETNLTTPEGLTQELKDRFADGSTEVYVKADERAQYATVAKVLGAIRANNVKETGLLTAQKEPAPVTIPVPPRGLPVSLDFPLSGSNLTAVQMLSSGPQPPIVKINDEIVPWEALQAKLVQLVASNSGKVLSLKADGKLPFAPVAHVIDVGHSTGLKVVLVVPAL